MSDPFGGKTPEEYLNSFGSGDVAAMKARNRQMALHKAELLAAAAEHLEREDHPPIAKVLGRWYEPPAMWVVLEREVRGTGISQTAWGLRHVNGGWHPQCYDTETRAQSVCDALILLWLEGRETPTVNEFNTARGEKETVQMWKERQGIDAPWCPKCPNPRQPLTKHHPEGQKEHV